MKLFSHINQLLFSHNCVIIPGFGGFVAEYRPAQLHPAAHEFRPPSKSIAFNPLLVNNDGLLSQHLAKMDNISFQQAEEQVRQFAKQCSTTLKSQKGLKCPGLGKIVLDLENKLQFHPDVSSNLLNDAYGLQSFVSKPISRSKEFAIAKQKEVIKESAYLQPTKKEKNRFKPAYLGWIAAASILGIFVLMQVLVQTKVIDYQYSNWQFWDKEKNVEPSEAKRFDPPIIVGSLQDQMKSFGATRSNAEIEAARAAKEATLATEAAEAAKIAEDSKTALADKAAEDKIAKAKEADKAKIASEKAAKEKATKEAKDAAARQAKAEQEKIAAANKAKADKALADANAEKARIAAAKSATNTAATTQRNPDLPLLQTQPKRGYYCIIGSFKDKQQAQARLDRLPAGNNGTAIIKARNGNYRAGVFIHQDEMTAELQLRKLRKEFRQSDAWIVKF